MELDETDPAVWLKLEAATDEYMKSNPHAFKNACERLLLHCQHDEKLSENQKPQISPWIKASRAGHLHTLFFVASVFFLGQYFHQH